MKIIRGIIYENKNYRLKTLGLEEQYLNMLKEFENIKQRESKRQKAKDEKINERFR
jgi:molecular chaperone GrpE (heat shock protein)